MSGQHTTCHNADGAARCPEEGRDKGCGIGIGWGCITAVANRDAKDLVGDAARHEQPMKP